MQPEPRLAKEGAGAGGSPVTLWPSAEEPGPGWVCVYVRGLPQGLARMDSLLQRGCGDPGATCGGDETVGML